MFSNLELFIQEKNSYRKKIEELRNNSFSIEELEEKLRVAKEEFRGKIRKYLSSAINILNTSFHCQYSIYKIGKDYDANFRVVETNIRKLKSEVIADMEAFKKQAETMTLSDEQIVKINLAMDILLTYSDDVTSQDENKEAYLKGANVTNTSVITNVARENNAFEPVPLKPESATPYASQLVVTNPGFQNNSSSNSPLIDPFANLYGENAVTNTSVPMNNGGVQNQIPNQNFGNPTPVPIPIPNLGSDPITNSTSQNGNMSSTPTMGGDNGNGQGFRFVDSVPNDTLDDYRNLQNNAPTSYDPQRALAYSQSLNAGNTPSTSGYEQAYNPVGTEDASIVSKIIRGMLSIPLITLLFFVIILLIFWGLDKADMMEKLADMLGEGLIYAEFGLGLLFAFLTANTVIDTIANRTKYISKHAVVSLTLFSGVTYGLNKLIPYLVAEVLPGIVKDEWLYQILIYYVFYIAFAYFVGTFILLLSFLRNNKQLIRRRLNITEWIGSFWIIYAFVIPAIALGCGYCGASSITDSLKSFYDYANSDVIIIVFSFALSALLLFFSKLEEKQL